MRHVCGWQAEVHVRTRDACVVDPGPAACRRGLHGVGAYGVAAAACSAAAVRQVRMRMHACNLASLGRWDGAARAAY